MTDDELSKQIGNLQQQLDKLKKDTDEARKKNFWISLLSSVILPVAITASGYLFSQAIKSQELKQANDRDSTENIHYQEQVQLSLQTQRLEKFKFITPYLDMMTGPDVKRRSMATLIITTILPDEGPQLLNVAIKSDPANTQKYQQALDNTQATLIANLFSDNASVRISSANDIMVSWYKTPGIVPPIIDYASKNMGNANGIYNTIIVLQNMHGSVLKLNKDVIRQFLSDVLKLKNMQKTLKNAAALNAGLDKL